MLRLRPEVRPGHRESLHHLGFRRLRQPAMVQVRHASVPQHSMPPPALPCSLPSPTSVSAASMLSLSVCETRDGWLVAWGFCGWITFRFSTVWLLPFTLL